MSGKTPIIGIPFVNSKTHYRRFNRCKEIDPCTRTHSDIIFARMKYIKEQNLKEEERNEILDYFEYPHSFFGIGLRDPRHGPITSITTIKLK